MDPNFKIKYIFSGFVFHLMEILVKKQIPLFFEAPCMLGLVDDVVGVAEAGYKAHQLNVILNVKTSEKGLQYGIGKCKSMIIGNQENCINNKH